MYNIFPSFISLKKCIGAKEMRIYFYYIFNLHIPKMKWEANSLEYSSNTTLSQ